MTAPDFSFENRLWQKGLKIVAGADEVGRGSFAGPVVAACVVFVPFKGGALQGKNKIRIDDSKKLTAKQRQIADIWIRKNALAFGIGQASVSQINKFGIKKATEIAYRQAVSVANQKLMANGSQLINHLLLDAFFVKNLVGISAGSIKKYEHNNYAKVIYGLKQTAIVKGDSRSFSIAAASIVAKVYRDGLMEKLSLKKGLTDYKWHKNKGYGTRSHQEAIRKYGICRHHRVCFVNTYFRRIGNSS